MSAAARARRLSEQAEIVVLERSQYVSFANYGLPYHLGGDIKDRDQLLLQTPQTLAENLKVTLYFLVISLGVYELHSTLEYAWNRFQGMPS